MSRHLENKFCIRKMIELCRERGEQLVYRDCKDQQVHQVFKVAEVNVGYQELEENRFVLCVCMYSR